MNVLRNPYPSAAGVLACIIWATAVVVAHKLAVAFGASTAVGIECLLGSVLLLGYVSRKADWRSMFAHSLGYYLTAGFSYVGHQCFLYMALGETANSAELVLVGLINYLWPILTVLLSVWILNKKPKSFLPVGLMLAVVGLVLAKVSFVDLDLINKVNVRAYLYALVGAISWALYSNCVNRFSNSEAQSALPLFMLFAAFPLIALGRCLGEQMNVNLAAVALLLGWTIFGTVALISWEYGIRRGNVHVLASFSMLIPVLSTIITCLVSGVSIGSTILIGALTVSLGAYISHRAIE